MASGDFSAPHIGAATSVLVAGERDSETSGPSRARAKPSNLEIGLDIAEQRRAAAIDEKPEFGRQAMQNRVVGKPGLKRRENRGDVDNRARVHIRDRARHDVANAFSRRVCVKQPKLIEPTLQGGQSSLVDAAQLQIGA